MIRATAHFAQRPDRCVKNVSAIPSTKTYSLVGVSFRASRNEFNKVWGDTRSAAPVGHARTQAGPPRGPYISHFTAFFIAGSVLTALALLFAGVLGPNSNSVQNPRFVSGGTAI